MLAMVEPEEVEGSGACLRKIAASHLHCPSVTLGLSHHCSTTQTAVVQLSGKAHKNSDHAHHCECHCVVMVTLVVKL